MLKAHSSCTFPNRCASRQRYVSESVGLLAPPAARMAFAARRIRQAGGIPDQQHTVSGHVSFGTSVQKIRMARHLRGQIKSNLSRFFQEGAEGRKVIGQGMGIEPPQADIEKVLFTDAPTVTLHVRTKIKLWNLRPDRTLIALRFRHLEFNFLRSNADFMASVGPPQSGNRTKMPPGADHKPGPELAVDNPEIARLFQADQRNSLVNARTATFQQKIIELAAANSVADWPAIIGFYFAAAHPAGAKTLDVLQNVAA